MTKDLRAKFLLVLITIGTRIPFVFNGYGNEEDSWTHVVNAFQNFSTSTYQISRLPGHPLLEGLLTGLYPYHSPLIYNGLSVISTVFCTLLVYQIHKQLKGVYSFLTALAFSFFPTVFVSSVSTIDYMFGMALLLGSTRLMLSGKAATAGILLGLAVGFRLSFLAWGLPLLFLYPGTSIQKHKDFFQFSSLAFLVTVVSYLPAYNVYGWSFFDTYKLPIPPLPKIIFKGTLGVVGLLGIVGFAFLAVNLLLARIKRSPAETLEDALPKTTVWALLIWVVLTLGLYLKIPEKSAFLIPLLPPLLWLLVRGNRTLWIRWSLMAFLLAPWLLGVDISDPLRGAQPSQWALHASSAGQDIFLDPFSGPIINDASKRFNKANTTQKIRNWMAQRQDSTLLIAGWWYPMVQVSVLENPFTTGVKMVYYATEEDINQALERGYPIYYAHEQERINQQKYGHSLADKYGIQLDLDR